MSDIHEVTTGTSASAPSPDSSHLIQQSSARDRGDNSELESREKPESLSSQFHAQSLETTSEHSSTNVSTKRTTDPVTRSPSESSCAQILRKNKSDDAKCGELKTAKFAVELEPATTFAYTPAESSPLSNKQIPLESGGSFVDQPTTAEISSSVTYDDIELSVVPSTEQQLDSDSNDNDSPLSDTDSYCGYEHVSKTILRKSDTVVRNSADSRKKRREITSEDPVLGQLDNSAKDSKEDQKDVGDSMSVRQELSKLEGFPDKESISNLTQNGLQHQAIQFSDKKKQKISINEKEEPCSVPKNGTKQKENAPAVPKKSRTVERKGKRKSSPSSPLEERITNTVIRRHVKVKPPDKKAIPTPTAQLASKYEAVSTANEKKEHISPAIKEARHSDIKPESLHRLDENKVISASLGELANEVSVSTQVCESVLTKAKSVIIERTAADVQSSSNVRMNEIFVKSDEADKETISKKAKVESKETNMILTHGGSSVSTPIVKHVSIREPPEDISSPDSNTVSQMVQKKTLKTPQFKDASGTDLKQSYSESLSEIIEPLEDKQDVSGNGEKVNELVNPKNKSCCFCWCCCCSCSCLSIDNQKKKQNLKHLSGSMEHYFIGEESLPTLEEIRTWGESFDKLMKCSGGRKIFREFLQCEYSEENILFWLACEELKKETKPEAIEEKARVIYEDFISILSPREVSLDSKVREVINKNMVNPTVNTFDEAQLQIYTLMHRDSYPRFVNSTLFRKLAQLPAPSRKGSMA